MLKTMLKTLSKAVTHILILSLIFANPIYCNELSDYEAHYGEDEMDIQSATVPEELRVMDDSNEYKDITQVFINTESGTAPTRDYLPATISINADSKSGINQGMDTTPIKIKIRGNSTAGLDKKPYNIKFDSKVEVLGFSKGKKFCFLANRYDKSFLRNYLAYSLSKECNLYYTPSFRFVDLWLNGTYVGNYLFTTPIETGSNRLNIDVDGKDILFEREASRVEDGVTYITSPTLGVRLAFNEPEEPTAEQIEYANQILANVDNAAMSINAMSGVIDEDSFIDFYIIEEFFKNRDVNYSSTRFYVKDDVFYAGPCWDFDLSAGNFPEGSNGAWYTNYYALNSPWISRMMNDSDFHAKFVARYKELQRRIQKIIYYYLDSIDYKYKASFKRDKDVAGWDYRAQGLDRNPEETHEGNVDFLKDWLIHRNEWLIETFGISGVIDYSSYYDNYYKTEVLFNKYNAVKNDINVVNLLNNEIDDTTSESEVNRLTAKLAEVVNRYPEENYAEGDIYTETDDTTHTLDVLDDYYIEYSSEIIFNGSKLKSGSNINLILKDKKTGKLYSGSDVRLTGNLNGRVGIARISIKSVKGIKRSKKLFKNSKTFDVEIKPLEISGTIVKNKKAYTADGDVILNTKGTTVKSIYVLVKNNNKVKKIRAKEFNVTNNVINLTGSIIGSIPLNN